MQTINMYPLKNSGVLYIYSIKKNIKLDPDYQRMGGIWTVDKRQLLIDSILNGFDIPKLYFHKYIRPLTDEKDNLVKYSIIDGRQRLESIWSFINGEFSISEDFQYYDDNKVKAGGLSYADLAKEYPELKLIFDQTPLPIICVETDDIDIIEEMFSRLNEAVTLNAAEKRNAFGGPMVKAIANLTSHSFFTENVPFSNKRYQHREVAAKFLLLDYHNKIMDTKKIFLDTFVKDFKTKKYEDVIPLVKNIELVLSPMSKVFIKKDDLLKTQGMAVLYFLIFRNLSSSKDFKKLSRKAFMKFEKMRANNRKKAESDIAYAKYELLEFDRYSLQGINDGASIRYRYEIFKKYLEAYISGEKDLESVFE